MRAAFGETRRRHATASCARADIVVRPIEPGDRIAWFALWAGYCAFYQTTIPAHVSEGTWRRIIDVHGAIDALVAVRVSTGLVVGFANYIVHPMTWDERPVCYLEDLFVRTDARGAGAGHALIAELLALGKRHAWARVYWTTRESNATARRLYERFCGHDDFIRYVVALDETPDSRA